MAKKQLRDDAIDRLIRIGIGLQQQQGQCLKQFNLTRLQAGILLELHHLPEGLFTPATMRADQLAATLQCTPGSISPEIKQLKERGLIAVGRGTKDKRERSIAITDFGRELAQEYAKSYGKLSAQIFKGMRSVWHEAIDKLERRIPGVGLRRRRRSPPKAAKPLI